MNEKHYAEVLIDGKVYTLGGIEEAQYLQRVTVKAPGRVYQAEPGISGGDD